MTITYADDEVVPIRELVDLYTAVGWLRYAADPDALAQAVDNSDYVVTARDDEGELVGLARCLSDDVSICHVQDVLVHPDHQRTGVGTVLLGQVITRFAHVRQLVLLTDDEPGQRAFYESLGLQELSSLGRGLHAFAHFRDLEPLD